MIDWITVERRKTQTGAVFHRAAVQALKGYRSVMQYKHEVAGSGWGFYTKHVNKHHQRRKTGQEDMKRWRIKAKQADRAAENVTELQLLPVIEEDPSRQLQDRLGTTSISVL